VDLSDETARRLVEALNNLNMKLDEIAREHFPLCGHGFIASMCRLCMDPIR
jgi:hypothetical protein